MKLLSLELSNFRQHRNLSIEISTGLTGIIGPNGAGKTTLVEAIAFALFGSKAIRGKVEDICTQGVEDADVGVTLVFEHDSNVFRIERGEKDASLFLRGEPEPMVVGSRDVTARVTSIVGMNYDEFVATYYTEQKGLEFLSGKKGAAERERFIVRMMGYDKLEKVHEALRMERRDRRSEIGGWEAALGSRSDLEGALSREREEIERLKPSYDESVVVLQKVLHDAEQVKKEFDKLESVRISFTKQKNATQEKQIRYEERIKRIKHLETERGELLESSVDGVPLREVLSRGDFGTRLESLRTELTKIESERKEKERELGALELDWRKRIERVRTEREVCSSRVKSALARKTRYESLDPESGCPTCGQELGEAFDRVRREFESELSDITGALQDLDSKLVDVEAPPPAILSLKEVISSTIQKVVTHEEELRVLSRFEENSRSVKRIDEELRRLREEVSELDVELKRLRDALHEMRFSEAEHEKLKGSLERANSFVDLARTKKLKLEGDYNTKRALLKRTEEQILEFDKKLEGLESARKRLLLLEEGDRFLTELRKHLNASIRPRLSELASEFISDLTDGRYNTIDLAPDFSPQVIEDGEAKPVISGGEADLLNLCMRLALSHMLAERAGQSFSLLILDEVFGSLDESRRTNVLTLLDRIGSRFEQILVITHMDDIKEGVEHLLYIDYDENTASSMISGVEVDLDQEKDVVNI